MLNSYFTCSRGVRQRDPLFLLFVSSRKLELINEPNNISITSHILYVDDVLIFFKGKIPNLKSIISTFKEYASILGKYVNCSKYFIFDGAMSFSRLNFPSDFVGFEIGYLPFVYLGLPLFKGKPKAVFLHFIAYKS